MSICIYVVFVFMWYLNTFFGVFVFVFVDFNWEVLYLYFKYF